MKRRSFIARRPAGHRRTVCLSALRDIARWVGILVVFLAPLIARASEPPPELRAANLRLLYADSLFANVNRNDALAAIKSWVETLGRRRGFRLTVEIGFYGRREELEARVEAQTVDMMTMTSANYLALAPKGNIDPVFIPGWNNASDDYVLITRRDPQFASLADLRKKSVLFYRIGDDLGRRWLEASLDASGLGAVNDFFGSMGDTTKPSSAILPVFFGKIDAAVAKRSSWETMKELNPQLDARLQVLAHSLDLPDAVLCVRKVADEQAFREDLIQSIGELSKDPQGQQILLLFKTDKMIPFQSRHMDGVRAILSPSPEQVMPSDSKAVVTSVGEEPKA